jgi:hypothetical protein
LFVSVLGASSYTYAEAARDQQMEAWIQAHIHSLEFFGGVPTLAVPDNTKTAVTRACRYDPDLNPTYQEFAVHYGMGVVPARPYKPRDKAKVESAVQVVERWIVAAQRNRKFFSLTELNQAISELLVRLSPSRVASIPNGELGTQRRSSHNPVVRANPKREAAPGDGLPLLSRHHSLGTPVLCSARGSCGGTGTPCQCVSVPECEIDLEELARRCSLISITTQLPTVDP